ncbi:glycosyltransferase [Microbacterium sp. YY-01]|uniref:glycosyltransferase n=1 Tax=Microbacterium sp. YY-01 TaxID=3421634 RepID=UPI003D16791A
MRTSVPLPHIVIVMPAYNEAEGITGFIDEIRLSLTPLAHKLSFVIADDRSTDTTATLFTTTPDVAVHTQTRNRGHGPTALAAYREGLALDPTVLVHVDGDGQFLGADIADAVRALVSTGADVVHGVRRGRTDPWYRKALTAAVRLLVAAAIGRGVPDVNTPLRVYQPAIAQALVDAVGPDALVPHIHFSLAEVRSNAVVRYVKVRSIPRRGSSTSGTMWGSGVRIALPPARLREFTRNALREVWQQSLRAGAPLRSIRLPVGAGAGASGAGASGGGDGGASRP